LTHLIIFFEKSGFIIEGIYDVEGSRKEGIYFLACKKHIDAGIMRVFTEQSMKRAKKLLKKNSGRRIPLLP